MKRLNCYEVTGDDIEAMAKAVDEWGRGDGCFFYRRTKILKSEREEVSSIDVAPFEEFG